MSYTWIVVLKKVLRRTRNPLDLLTEGNDYLVILGFFFSSLEESSKGRLQNYYLNMTAINWSISVCSIFSSSLLAYITKMLLNLEETGKTAEFVFLRMEFKQAKKHICAPFVAKCPIQRFRLIVHVRANKTWKICLLWYTWF